LSIACFLAYLFFAVQSLSDNQRLFQAGDYWRALRSKRFLTALVVYIGVQVIVSCLIAGRSPVFLDSLKNLVSTGIRVPFVFAVGHVVYFGSTVILLFLFWKEFCRTIHGYGAGLTAVVFLGVLFSAGAEARHCTAFAPVFWVFLAKTLDGLDWDARRLWLLFAVALIYSKAWLTINDYFSVSYDVHKTMVFPLQLYYMNDANFMTYGSYAVQGAVIAVTFAVFYKLKNPSPQVRDIPAEA
jgi:hypothetical protein